jgi:septum formation topological specificity factor MinE
MKRGPITMHAHDLRVCHAIRLLAEGMPNDEVGRAVRAKARTFEVWQNDENFQLLVLCVKEHRRLREAYDTLEKLTTDAVEVLRKNLKSSDDRIAVQAAKEVLDRVGLKAGAIKEENETIIRFEYGTPDHQAYTAASWADRNPATPGALQGGGVRETLREDGDGEDYDR